MNPPVSNVTHVIHDMAGKEIKPGVLIVYACSTNGSPNLAWGRVERVKYTKPRSPLFFGETAITFRGIDRWGGDRLQPRLRKTLGTLRNYIHIMVIPWNSQVPEAIRNLLDPDGEFSSQQAGSDIQGIAARSAQHQATNTP